MAGRFPRAAIRCSCRRDVAFPLAWRTAVSLSEDVYEVAVVDEDCDRNDDPGGGIMPLPDLETDGIHLRIIDPLLVPEGLDRVLL
jgi:hypothetical protein